MRNLRIFTLAAALLAASLSVVHAAENVAVTPVELEPIRHRAANLEVIGPAGTVSYTAAELEEFATYRLSTDTPWREVAADFDGVLLTDILTAHGLDQVDAIRVTAENDYQITIPRSAWERTEILVATRVDGKAHSRRARGPIQFVMSHAEYKADPELEESYWVWMAARIEPVE